MHRTLAAMLAIAIGSGSTSCAERVHTDPAGTDVSTPNSATKTKHVSSELLTIYAQRYSADPRACSDPNRDQLEAGSSVVVDATARRDAALLLNQLRSIGLLHAQVAAPVVSGYLPVCAIPQLEDCCSELRFIRKSVIELQKQ